MGSLPVPSIPKCRRGMDIVICTTAQTDEEARELLTLVGAPFER